MEKAYRYTRALSRWIKAGRPARSDEVIISIFENHCFRCSDYDENSKSCNQCGCRVNTKNNPLSNKIAMATENCPIGKWGDRT